MKYLLSWLKDYIEINEPPEKLAEDLSMFVLEVESVTKTNDDYIFDLEITPNRGDCLSHLGLARQIGAMYNRKLKTENLKLKTTYTDLNKNLDIMIEYPKICPRYTAQVIDNIKIKPSPDWLKKRLESYGFRSINNIVDITNYVMIALGQPMHAYDYNKIADGKMNICLSKDHDEVTTLDGKIHKLRKDTIIIKDDEKIYDLAGIMGGLKSEIDVSTTTIVLEGAIFNPVLIRRTSKYLNHQTDASYRYERDVDIEGNMTAFELANTLILETLPEAKFGKIYDIYQNKYAPKSISFEDSKINNLIGCDLNHDEIISALKRSYFEVVSNVATVPSFRAYDISIWQDLAEEVARIIGINKIKRIEPVTTDHPITNIDWLNREKVKDILINLGFSEIYTQSFSDINQMHLLGVDIDNLQEIINPISPETQYLRPDMKISLINAVAKNPWSPELNIFEVGKVFGKDTEKWQIGIATCDKYPDRIQDALQKLNINNEVETVSQDILAKFKIRRPTHITLIDLDDINDESINKTELNFEVSNNKYKPVSKYPPTVRDLAFIVDNSVKADDIIKSISSISADIFLVEMFDEFSSDKFGSNKKNIAFHIWIQNMKGPVLDSLASDIISKIIITIENNYDAKIRS